MYKPSEYDLIMDLSGGFGLYGRMFGSLKTWIRPKVGIKLDWTPSMTNR